jgi:hypothetical protein
MSTTEWRAKVLNLYFEGFVFCLFFCMGLDFYDFLRVRALSHGEGA